MDRKIDVELVNYKSIDDYQPQMGDIIIKHGLLFAKTKWFGVVNNIKPDGTMCVIKEGLPCLLFTIPPDKMKSHTIDIHPLSMKRGAYTVMQQNKEANGAIWYV